MAIDIEVQKDNTIIATLRDDQSILNLSDYVDNFYNNINNIKKLKMVDTEGNIKIFGRNYIRQCDFILST